MPYMKKGIDVVYVHPELVNAMTVEGYAEIDSEPEQPVAGSTVAPRLVDPTLIVSKEN